MSGLFRGARKTDFCKLIRWDAGAFLFSVLSTVLCVSSSCILLGSHFFKAPPIDIFAWITPGYAIAIAVLSLLLFVVLYLIAVLFFSTVKVSAAKRRSEPKPFAEVLRTRFIKYAAILFICWLPWLLAHLPGTFDQGTIWQALIWRNPEIWYDHHPWLTTVLFGSVLDAGSSLGSQSLGLMAYSIVQSVLMASSLAFLFCYIARFDVPKVLFGVCFVLCCALPVYASFAGEMVKDSLFTLAWIPFAVVYVEAVRTKGACLRSPGRIAFFLAVILLAILTRKTGIYLIAPSLIVLALHSLPQWRLRIAGVCAGALVLFLAWGALLPAFGVAKGPSKELFSLPLQQTALYVAQHAEEVTEEEKAAISAVLPYDQLSGIYEIQNADNVKDSFKNPPTGELIDYLAVWAQMGFKGPSSYLTATLGTSTALFCPLKPFILKDNFSIELVQENVEFFTVFTAEGMTSEELADRAQVTQEGLTRFEAVSPLASVVGKYESLINKTPLRIVNSVAFMTLYLPLLIACFALSCRKERSFMAALLMALLPAALLVASIAAGPLVLTRYCVPATFVAPLIVALPWVLKGRLADCR